jgi:hypothetical protein
VSKEADAGSGSAWSGLGQVRIPLEHWELIVEQVRAADPAQAERLEHSAILDGRSMDAGEGARLLELFDHWGERIRSGPPLASMQPSVEIPEPMPPAEHARMLADIARLLRRCLASGRRFDSWVD